MAGFLFDFGFNAVDALAMQNLVKSIWFKVGAGIFILLAFILVFLPKPDSGPAHFARGNDVLITSKKIGAHGEIIVIENTKTPLDGTTIEIPAGAVNEEITLALSYNTGEFRSLPTGKASEAVIKFAFDRLPEFKNPAIIHAKYDATTNTDAVVVGYSINEEGRIRPIDAAVQDSKAGTVDFYIFEPGTYTWIFTDKM